MDECHVNSCENRASLLRTWLSIHRGICKDNISLYLAAFKACRRSRAINPIQAITETLKIIYILTATTFLVKSDNCWINHSNIGCAGIPSCI
jgi:hypothetical protein